MTASPFASDGTRAIDILKAESRLDVPVRHVLKFPSGRELPLYVTPITLAQRKQAQRNAGGEEDQLALNLQLLVMKARDEDGRPLFSVADLPELRNAVDAQMVADLIGRVYSGRAEDEDLADLPPKSLPGPSEVIVS